MAGMRHSDVRALHWPDVVDAANSHNTVVLSVTTRPIRKAT